MKERELKPLADLALEHHSLVTAPVAAGVTLLPRE